MRAYWDGNEKPSIEAPVGDFFGLNLGDYIDFESAWIACSPGKSLNAYFAMPYRKGARITITNEGSRKVHAFYSNIDFVAVEKLPDDALYFHAQYHQEAPCQAIKSDGKNLDGKHNHVYCETHGRGQLIGVTLGVIQNAEGWWGEGDEMIFVDGRVDAGDHGHRIGGLLLRQLELRRTRGRASVFASPVRRAVDPEPGARRRALLLLPLPRARTRSRLRAT